MPDDLIPGTRLALARPARAVGVLAVLTIVVILVLTAFLLMSLRTREEDHARQETVGLTRMLMEQTEKSLTGVDLVLQNVQERLATAYGRQFGLDSVQVQLLLNSRASGLKLLNSIFLLDENGVLANSSREGPVQSISMADRDYFRVFAHGRSDFVYLSKPVRNRLNNAWTLYLSRPLRLPNGAFRGVVVAAIYVSDLEATLGSVQLDYVRPVSIYMADGTLLASVPHRDPLIGLPAPELGGKSIVLGAKQVDTLGQRPDMQEGASLTIGKLASFPLFLGVTDLEAESMEGWRDTAIPVAVGALLVSAFAGFVALYLIGKLQRKETLTQALNSANDRYQNTVNSVMDAIVAVDSQLTILMFNPAAERMFGWSASDAIGRPLNMLIPQRFWKVHVEHMGRFASTTHTMPLTLVPDREIIGLRSDGTEFPVETTFSRSIVDGKLQMTAVLRDATQKRKSEQALREANEQLRALSKSLQQVREEERTRISRELHDDLGQQLTGLKLSLSWLANRIKEGRETAAQNVDDMRHQLDTAIASVRRIASELRPRVLDDLDFAEALTWQTKEFTRHSGLQVDLDLPAADLVRDNNCATALFRIVQEALTNVVRHSQATKVAVGLTVRGDVVVLEVQDNGIGFDNSAIKAGVGLVGMRERCATIGGEFGIVSHVDGGTRIVVSIPVTLLSVKEVEHEA